MFMFFLKGCLIGFALAVPVGPIGLLCIHRSLHDGFRIGLMTGLGAAVADGTYGLIAGLGLTTLSSFLIHQANWIRLIGGICLMLFGLQLFFTKPKIKNDDLDERSALHAFVTTFFLTLTNPATILAFTAIFAALGFGTLTIDPMHTLPLVLGITLGSAIWWLLLSGTVSFVLHHRLSPTVMQNLNRGSGSLIFVFGIVAFFL